VLKRRVQISIDIQVQVGQSAQEAVGVHSVTEGMRR
jgi:hypothetical protein